MTLSISSPVDDFVKHFDSYFRELSDLAKKVIYSYQRQNASKQSWDSSIDDRLKSYAPHVGALRAVLDLMMEAEERIVDSDLEEDESEQSHTYGEIFALKQAYTSIVDGLPVLEKKIMEMVAGYALSGASPRLMLDVAAGRDVNTTGWTSIGTTSGRTLNVGGLIANGSITANKIMFAPVNTPFPPSSINNSLWKSLP